VSNGDVGQGNGRRFCMDEMIGIFTGRTFPTIGISVVKDPISETVKLFVSDLLFNLAGKLYPQLYPCKFVLIKLIRDGLSRGTIRGSNKYVGNNSNTDEVATTLLVSLHRNQINLLPEGQQQI
jgi:hypothetical protein